SGYQPDAASIAWWEALACVRWAVIALQQAQRHLSGNETSLELALTGRLVPEIEQDALFHLRAFLSAKGLSELGDQAAEDQGSPLPPPASPASSRHAAANQALDMPDGSDLLQIARSILLNEVMPVTPPDQHYNLRMAARAMGIALREAESRTSVHEQYLDRIRQFYEQAGMAGATPSIPQLVTDINNRCFGPDLQASLFALMDDLLNLQLQLSNPRRVGLDAA
ncbi:MAG TPA: DUF6285 domain-containing protein, partial [Burkholderiaceae bacterium]|nr:DUF6285 domain-containing protein [Burkholderiaceae bacterium]